MVLVTKGHSLSFIRLPPYILSLSFPNQLVTEIRVSNRNQFLSTFPGGASGQIYDSIFGSEEICLTAGTGNNIPVEIWHYAGV